MLIFETVLSKVALLVFLLSTLLTLYIGKYKVPDVSKKTQLARTLTLGLWGFVPPHVAERVHQRNLWNWRKLLVCGVMMSSSVVLMSANKLSPPSSLKLALFVLSIWTIGLHFFWHFFIPAQEGSESVKNNAIEGGQFMQPVKNTEERTKSDITSGNESKNNEYSVSDGWAQKVKTRDEDRRLPTTIITGFLGSGKTTLVNHLLGNTIGIRILVVENEVGAEGIDHELLLQQTKKEQIILMNNGCVCCSVRGDLIQTFRQLFSSDAFSLLNWIVIETTGLADPGPVIQTLFMDSECKKYMRLDACITVVDAKHISQHFESAAKGESGAHTALAVPEAIQQLAFADRILLNKIDLVTSGELSEVVEQVKTINPTASILKTQHSQISPEEILNIHAFDASKNAVIFERYDSNNLSTISSNGHNKGLFHIETNADGKITVPKKKKKGYSIGSLSGNKKVSQGGGYNVDVDNSGNNYSISSTTMNIIDKAKVSTVSLTSTSLIDLDLFNMWMGQLLQEKGNDLYRFKGILAMQHYDEKFVVQGVHMLFNGERGEKWETGAGERRSRLVFIGIKLNHTALEKGFQKCLVSEKSSDSLL